MADYWTEFSAVLTQLTLDEAAWLHAQLNEDALIIEWNSLEDIEPRELYKSYDGAFVLLPDYVDACESFEFAFEFDENTQWGRHLWVHNDYDRGNPEMVALLVQVFLEKFRPDKIWALSWAETCSKPRIDAFGGGAVLVSAEELYWVSAHGFVNTKGKELEKEWA